MELLDINTDHFAIVASLLPFLSTVICVICSLVLHFDQATTTHCRVANYLPSISAATGDYSPEKYIWRVGIGYHSSLRLFGIALEFNLFFLKASHQTRAKTSFMLLNKLNTFCYTLENFALVLLTFVSADENYEIHEKSFIVFMVTSMLHMLFSCILYHWTCQVPAKNKEVWILRKKVSILLANYSCFALAIYFFFRHNWYCESGVYTLFAFCEYMAVFSNIYFNYSIIDDIKGQARLKLSCHQFNSKTQ
ncbi:post-GPI attachment to proteins factor 2 [Exaiptasia diaphana]|uniref:CWH43-like N-terminal domain-containing protein n=1 Tax=Exaiptasia diaphana TaxID=2652724 RepID=A0A913XFY2_EXADI|nr:post-GPI attachment to proteins factor 2 [Exaiptasia diaphana]KXJ12247.1 Post-GPI attachment to proteins factor 2 [Exaiptasia diaphana]